jgi:hypothetical protein
LHHASVGVPLKPFWIWKHLHVYEVYAHEVHAHEVYAYEVHAYEVHAHEVHAREVHAYEAFARTLARQNTVAHLFQL